MKRQISESKNIRHKIEQSKGYQSSYETLLKKLDKEKERSILLQAAIKSEISYRDLLLKMQALVDKERNILSEMLANSNIN